MLETEPASCGLFCALNFLGALRAPVPSSVAVLGSLLRLFVAMLRVLLRYVLRKLLILKQCYVLRFFENECDGQKGQDLSLSANRTSIYSRKATHTILQKI